MSKYRKIAETVAAEITDGHFQPGERIYSINELCERYQVSYMTAVRAQRELERVGAVRLVRGGGAFANQVSDFNAAVDASAATDLKRVVVLKLGVYRAETFHRETLCALAKRCEAIGLETVFQQIDRQSVSLDTVNAFRPEPHTGYVVVSDSFQSHFAGGALLLSPQVRSVLVDSIISGSHAVLPDNYDGVNRLIDHLLAGGYRRLYYAGGISGHLGMVNYAERRHAFEVRCRVGKLNGEVIESRDFAVLAAAARSAAPGTAFLFGQDDSALRFRKILLEMGVDPMPGITGFDGFATKEAGLEQLTTVRVDRKAMGRAAADVLSKSVELPEIVRVPGIIQPGEST